MHHDIVRPLAELELGTAKRTLSRGFWQHPLRLPGACSLSWGLQGTVARSPDMKAPAHQKLIEGLMEVDGAPACAKPCSGHWLHGGT